MRMQRRGWLKPFLSPTPPPPGKARNAPSVQEATRDRDPQPALSAQCPRRAPIPAHSGRQTQGHAGPRPEPPRQGVTRVTRRGGPATPLPRPVTQCPPPPPPARRGTKRAGSGRGAGAGTPRAPCWRGRRGPGGGGEQRNSRTPRPRPAAPRPHRARPAGGAEGRRPRTMRPGPAGCAHLGPCAASNPPPTSPLSSHRPAPGPARVSPAGRRGRPRGRRGSLCSPPAQPEPQQSNSD